MRPTSVSSGILCAGALILSITLSLCAQERSRVLNWFEGKPPATGKKVLEIVEIKVEGKPVRLGEPFTAGRAWFKSLVFRVKNISAKPVQEVVISFDAPELDMGWRKKIIWHMPYQITRVGVSISGTDVWQYVPPGGEVDLRFTDQLLGSALHKSIEEINVGVNEVKILPDALVTFTDGTNARCRLLIR